MDTERQKIRPQNIFSRSSFRQVWSEKNSLEGSGGVGAGANSRLEDAQTRLRELIGDMHKKGAFDNVEARYKVLVGLKQEGRLTWEIILEELRFVPVADDHFGLSKEDLHYGIIGWYYQVRLDKLMTFKDSS